MFCCMQSLCTWWKIDLSTFASAQTSPVYLMQATLNSTKYWNRKGKAFFVILFHDLQLFCALLCNPRINNDSDSSMIVVTPNMMMYVPSSQSNNPRRNIQRRSSTTGILQTKKKHDQPRRRTSFTTISVREYEQCLGDCPATQEGAPISLSWAYEERKSISLDEYEEARKPRRRRSELVLGVMERRQKLLSAGSSFLEVIRAERAVAMKNGLISRMRSNEDQNKSREPASTTKSVTSRAA